MNSNFPQFHNPSIGVSYSASPVFLVGAERSGTTLLRLMLDSHPDIAWLNEFEYAIDKLPSKNEWPDLANYYDWLMTHRIFTATGFIIDKTLSYPELIKSFLIQKMMASRKNIIGATCHRHFDKLLRIWPNARFVHILRDPRDVARSNIGMGWAGNVWTGVDRWIEAEKLWNQLVCAIPDNTWTEVSYENLVTFAREELDRLCAFIGVKYHPAMLEYPARTTYGSPSEKLKNQWKHKLTQKEIMLVEEKANELMVARGYKIAGRFCKIGIFRKIYLRLQDKFSKKMFTFRRYGILLALSFCIARRFRLYSWSKKIQLRINEIDVSFLK